MKTAFKISFMFYSFWAFAVAAQAAAVVAPIDPGLAQMIELLLGSLVQKHPILTAVWVFMGAMRTFFKPTMKILSDIVELTPWQQDNILLGKLRANKYFRYLEFFLDYTTSIKLPPAPKPVVEAPKVEV